MSQDVKLERPAAGDVYRVNPMDREAGGRSRDEGFERFMKRKKGESEGGENETLPGEPESPPADRPAPEDGVVLSPAARAALESGGTALAARVAADQAQSKDLPANPPPNAPAERPASGPSSGVKPVDPPVGPAAAAPGAHINITA